MLAREATGTAFRLIGVGITGLTEAAPNRKRKRWTSPRAARAKAELAVDRIRDKFGRSAVARGIGFGEEE